MKKVTVPLAAALAMAILFFATGCTGNAKPVDNESEGPKPNPARATNNATIAVAAAPKSVFTIDGNSKDPFFPQARKAAPAANNQSAPGAANASNGGVPADIAQVLMAGFQGVGGTTESRMALLYNTILEPGRSTVISVPAGNQNRPLAVKCRDITRDTVILEVEGYGQVVLTRK